MHFKVNCVEVKFTDNLFYTLNLLTAVVYSSVSFGPMNIFLHNSVLAHILSTTCASASLNAAFSSAQGDCCVLLSPRCMHSGPEVPPGITLLVLLLSGIIVSQCSMSVNISSVNVVTFLNCLW